MGSFFFIVGSGDDEVSVYHQGANGDFAFCLCFSGFFQGQHHVFCIGHGISFTLVHGFYFF